MRHYEKGRNYTNQELKRLTHSERLLFKQNPEFITFLNDLKERGRNFEVGSLKDTAVRKLLKMKIIDHISDEDEKELEHQLFKVINPDILTFNTLDFVYRIYSSHYSYPKWYGNRFCRCGRDIGCVIAYTREEKVLCFNCDWLLFYRNDSDNFCNQ